MKVLLWAAYYLAWFWAGTWDGRRLIRKVRAGNAWRIGRWIPAEEPMWSSQFEAMATCLHTAGWTDDQDFFIRNVEFCTLCGFIRPRDRPKHYAKVVFIHPQGPDEPMRVDILVQQWAPIDVPDSDRIKHPRPPARPV